MQALKNNKIKQGNLQPMWSRDAVLVCGTTFSL